LFTQGAAAYGRRDYGTAIERLEQLVKIAAPGPALDSIYFTIATAKLKNGDAPGAVEAFRLYLSLYPTGLQLDDARLGLAQALLKSGRLPDSITVLEALQNLGGGTQGVDNYAALVSLTMDITDALLEDKQIAEALTLLQAVPSREQLIERQRQRCAELERLYKFAVAAAGSLGSQSSQASQRDTLASRLADASEVLKYLEKTPTFDLPRLLRQGRCHLELDQPWEAIVVYLHCLASFPQAPDRAYALHGMIFARQALGREAEAQALCQRFIEEFPNNPLMPEVAAMGGQFAQQLKDPTTAESFFGTALAKSSHALRERVLFQLGVARFNLRNWSGARDMFDRYVREFPKGEWVDNAAYRSAVSWFLDDNDLDRYKKAEENLGAFINAHPQSAHLSDAYYRLAICKFAFQEYQQAVEACIDWEKRFPTDSLLAEVLSLKADVQKTLGRPDDALETYLRAASASMSDDVLTYTLNEAARLLEAKKDWTRLTALFRTQVDRQPESPLALGWLYWIARSEARAGKPDEAWDFLASHLGTALADPAREDVENMIRLMAQIRARQRPSAGDAATENAAPGEALRTRLQLGADAPPLSLARIRFYEATLLRLKRKSAEADRIILAIGREFTPDNLSAPLLAEVGEALFKAGDTDKARKLFSALLSRFHRSDYRDYAYVGLGDLALTENKPAEALKSYEDAVDLAGARHRMREATVGKARALFDLGRLDEAEKLFETIASAREWRGEATALSLHYLGLIAVRNGDLPKGIAFFQRVFVSQGRYSEWVAKSYWESGQAFEKLGKPGEAASTYREMLRNERIRDRAEIALATQRLATLVTP